jgi:hypothetical protein
MPTLHQLLRFFRQTSRKIQFVQLFSGFFEKTAEKGG